MLVGLAVRGGSEGDSVGVLVVGRGVGVLDGCLVGLQTCIKLSTQITHTKTRIVTVLLGGVLVNSLDLVSLERPTIEVRVVFSKVFPYCKKYSLFKFASNQPQNRYRYTEKVIVGVVCNAIQT